MVLYRLARGCQMKGRQLKCADCSYVTNYPNALQVHRLKEHVRDEVQNKPFKCTVCTYQTSFRSNLQKHQRVHTGERPYVCCCCLMRFSFRSNHKRHEQRCLATRGVHCPHPSCRFVSNEYGNLTAHIQVSHAQTPALTSNSFSNNNNNNHLNHSHGRPSDIPGLGAADHKALLPLSTDSSGTPSLNLTLNQFTLGQDPAQQAMIDLYYKTLTNTAIPSYPPRLDLTHPIPHTLPVFKVKAESSGTVNHDLNVKIKDEPDVKDSAIKLHRARSLPRKQSHPRRTVNEFKVDMSDESTDDGTKFHFSDLQDMGAQKEFQEKLNILPIKADCEMGTIQINTVTKPQIMNIKTEPREVPPMPVKDIKLEESRSSSTHPCCSTSSNSTISLTSVTPSSSEAATEMDCSAASACSLPFTLDAVLGNLSLGQLLDVLVQNGRLYRCQHCKILFEEYATYVLHMGCHGNINPFSCHFCGAVFHEKFGFLTHFMKCVGK